MRGRLPVGAPPLVDGVQLRRGRQAQRNRVDRARAAHAPPRADAVERSRRRGRLHLPHAGAARPPSPACRSGVPAERAGVPRLRGRGEPAGTALGPLALQRPPAMDPGGPNVQPRGAAQDAPQLARAASGDGRDLGTRRRAVRPPQPPLLGRDRGPCGGRRRHGRARDRRDLVPRGRACPAADNRARVGGRRPGAARGARGRRSDGPRVGPRDWGARDRDHLGRSGRDPRRHAT